MAADTIKLEMFPLRYSGTFDFQALYHAAKAWLIAVYATVNWEKLYKDKVSGPGIREVEIQLRGFIKYDRFRKWNIEIDFKTWDMKDIEVNGKKMQQGRIEMKITGTIELDYNNMYKKATGITKFLSDLMIYFMKKDRELMLKKKSETEMYNLQNQFKKILQIPI